MRSEKGSITVYVLIAMLTFSAFLMAIYVRNSNKEMAQIEITEKIKSIYEKYNKEEVYATLTGQVPQILGYERGAEEITIKTYVESGLNVDQNGKEIIYFAATTENSAPTEISDERGAFGVWQKSKDISLSGYEEEEFFVWIKNEDGAISQLLDTTVKKSEAVFLGTKAGKTLNYRIYGNSVQNGDPTPENPVEVESVGNKTSNLLDIDNMVDGFISMTTGDAYEPYYNSSYPNAKTSQLIPVKSGETIYYKFTTNNADNIRIRQYDSSVLNLGKYYAGASGSIQISQDGYIAVLFIGYENAVVETAHVSKSPITDYEPYGYNIPIRVSGSNLYNPKDKFSSANTSEVDQNGWITLTCDNSAGTSTRWLNIYTKASDKIKPNTSYKLVVEIEEISNCNLTACSTNTSYASSIGQFQNGLGSLSTTGTHIATIKSREDLSIAYTMLRSELVVTAGQNASIKFRMYVLEDLSVENIYLKEPLRKIGNYADYIDFENQKVVRKIKEKVFNGEETFSYYSTAQGNMFRINLAESFSESKEKISLCNMYKVVNQGYRTDNTISGVGTFYDFINNNYSSVDKFKEYLKTLHIKNNSLKLYYQLATPIEESIELPQLETFDQITRMEVLTNTYPSKIEISY